VLKAGWRCLRSGDWRPEALTEPSRLFQWPVNLFVAGAAVTIWYLFSPIRERASTFTFGWIAGS